MMLASLIVDYFTLLPVQTLSYSHTFHCSFLNVRFTCENKSGWFGFYWLSCIFHKAPLWICRHRTSYCRQMTRTSLVASTSHRTAPVTRCVVPDNYLLHIPIAGFVGACLGFMINLFFIFSQWRIAKNGGGYTQRGVAKGLKVPCLFMITEVSIRCQKNPEVGIRRIPAYTPQYTTVFSCIIFILTGFACGIGVISWIVRLICVVYIVVVYNLLS